MKITDIIKNNSDAKRAQVAIHAIKRRKKNPVATKATGSFIDMFGGMLNYASPNSAGSVNPM